MEDAAAWMLATLALLGILVSLGVGTRVYDSTSDRARVEAASRAPAMAVLLEDTTSRSSVEGREGAVPVPVPVRWIGRDGVERIGQARVRAPMRAGETVTVWADQQNQLVSAPISSSEAVTASLFAGLMTLLGIAALLASAWAGIRRVTLVRNCLRWERDWTKVEPVWSGRTRGGSVP